MDTPLYILFSESDIGVHSPSSTNKATFTVIPLVFPPLVKKTEEGLVYASSLVENEQFLFALSLYRKERDKRKVSFLVGYDIDEMGEAMSESLLENLEREGIPSESIIRMPLTYEGYIVVREFTRDSLYKKFLFLQQEFMKTLQTMGIKKHVGFAKALSLMGVVIHRLKVFKIDTSEISLSGTSSATCVTKEITGEK